MYVSPTLSEQLLRLHFRGRIGETTRLGGEMKKRVISNRKKTKKTKKTKKRWEQIIIMMEIPS